MATWSWLDDRGWKQYDAAVQQRLEATFAAGPGAGNNATVDVTLAGRRYVMDMVRMVQMNALTSFQRPIARSAPAAGGAGGGDDGGGGKWEYRDDTRWRPYDDAAQTHLSAARGAGWGATTLRAPRGGKLGRGASYTIVFDSLLQINDHSGFRRKIRQTSAGAAGLPTPPLPTPPLGLSDLGVDDAGGVVHFRQHNGDPDFAAITKWRVLTPHVDYDPASECSITCEELGTAAETGEEVVALSCSSDAIPCVFRASTAARSLAAARGQCPSCKFRHVLPGPQPSGSMRISRGGPACAGTLADASVGVGGGGGGPAPCPTSLVIQYSFRDGTQGPQHPAPGAPFSGTRRMAFLPDNARGRAALKLLVRAFLAGQLFSVGASVTTGQQNTTVWGSIHQKTSPVGGAAAHGWPDEGYFDRVHSECAALGIIG